ncbi:MAG TPA: NusG domain II-containing protein [Oscillospiraceae bacterium]|nr:NusG domain II-containing protein [Oscillospiraceae bacterium]HNW04659.1 NusG domain II-containing protein [Oscillospiraceae bacterium]HPV99628.1 NusG domain II-containing protein [Oscillospiraceae bacterium]
MERKLLTKRDALVVIAVILVAAAVLLARRYLPAGRYPVAVVTVGGGEILRIDLADAEDGVIELGEPDVRLKIEDHRIRFYEASCPDKLCENTGWLSKAGDTAVCMPYRAAVKLVER